MKDKWLIGIDFDGTIVKEYEGKKDENNFRVDEIHPKTIEGIKKTIAAGHYVVALTGRNWSELKNAYNDVGMNSFAIMGAGGTIAKPLDNSFKPIKVLISKKIINEILEDDDVKNILLHLRIEHGNNTFAHKYRGTFEFDHQIRLFEPIKDFDGIVDFDSESICMNFELPNEKIHDFKEKLQKKYGHEINFSFWFTSENNTQSCLLMNPSKADKGDSLLKVAKILNIPIERTMAIGDSDNDINAIKKASIGVAMKNATDHLKNISQFTTNLTNQEGGVGDFLINYFNLD